MALFVHLLEMHNPAQPSTISTRKYEPALGPVSIRLDTSTWALIVQVGQASGLSLTQPRPPDPASETRPYPPYSFSLLCSVFKLMPRISAARVLLLRVCSSVLRMRPFSAFSTVVAILKRTDSRPSGTAADEYERRSAGRTGLRADGRPEWLRPAPCWWPPPAARPLRIRSCPPGAAPWNPPGCAAAWLAWAGASRRSRPVTASRVAPARSSRRAAPKRP